MTKRIDYAELTPEPRDQLPKESFQKAPHGALADRDYTRTTLDPYKLLKLWNDYRKEKGLEPVELDANLTKAAMAHSMDLAKWDRISHYGSDGSNPWDRMARTPYGNTPEARALVLKNLGKIPADMLMAKLGAENVGTGQATVDNFPYLRQPQTFCLKTPSMRAWRWWWRPTPNLKLSGRW